MNSKERRKHILELLNYSESPLKGNDIAEKLGVTRQIIVKDIAILRAAGNAIIATPEGYMSPKEEKNVVTRVVAIFHTVENIEEELKIIVSYGGIVKDVIVEHSLYGEIRCMLMIKTLYDVKNFIVKFKEYKAEPLSALTGGVHLHTIVTENEDIMKKIIHQLKLKGFLIN
ncbi:putative transcription repressor NiaR [Clostridium acetireducens DSM 10703]|uniref:Putative transcription repressor NiaR n=1 Tax=Clostridium acetireducens DSM 10703 TaxID=1121290 RepID=A0A1E8EUH4_9CLOT|nr:transcription repressor NadR [Clostridium acetireducens]OFH96900.1 putative transcription repressor NiaR [Clostridium acetireducens DSM 10703]